MQLELWRLVTRGYGEKQYYQRDREPSDNYFGKIMTVFTFIHKNFRRAKLKISRLITLAEISRQPNIDFLHGY